MDKILPRKYNNPVVIGLFIGLVVAISVAIYYMYKEDSHPATQIGTGQLPASHTQHVVPHNIETKVVDVTNKPTLVLIWADWCGHSNAFLNTWGKIAAILGQDGTIEALALEDKQNAAEIENLKSAMPDFRGFPHVRFFPQGVGVDKPSTSYSGQRTEEEILKFAYKSVSTTL